MSAEQQRQWWLPSGLAAVLLLVVFVFISVFTPLSLEQDVTGRFDLSALTAQSNKPFQLSGKWRGVTAELMLPDATQGQDLKVPGEYGHFATDLLTIWADIKVNPSTSPNGIFLPGVNSSQRVFVSIDGKKPVLVFESGVVSDQASRSVPSYLRDVIEIPKAQSNLRLIFHIANHHYPRLSIWESPLLGDYETLVKARRFRLLIDAMLMGVFLFLALYFVRLYQGRSRESALIPFGLTCFLMSLRVFSTGPAADFFLQNITMADFTMRWRLDYLGIVMTAPMYALHLGLTFGNVYFKRFYLTFLALSTGLALGVMVSAPGDFAQLLRPLELGLGLLALSTVVLVGLASKQGHPLSRDYLWLNGFLVLAFFHDILLSFNFFSSIQISHYVFCGMLILLGNQLAHRFAKALSTAEDLSRTLQARVDEQTRDLQRRASESEELQKRAETGLTSLTKLTEQRLHFFQTISHELRTPLTLLLGPLERVHSNYPQDLEVIAAQKNAKRLLRLVNQLLEFHRVQGGVRLSTRPNRLSWVIEGCIEQFQMVAELRQIRFQFSDTDDALSSWVRMDPDILDKVLTNLLSNAFKYLGQDEDEPEILVLAERVGARVRLSVIDNGVGMTKEELSRVFSPFKRGNHSLTRDVVGTGLGLSIAKTLTERMGGRIGVASIPKSGTTFWIEFDEIVPPVRSIMAERVVSLITRRPGIEAVLEKVLHERPDIELLNNEIRPNSMMNVVDWQSISHIERQEVIELCDEDSGAPFVIIVNPEDKSSVDDLPKARVWCVVEEPVPQGELGNIFEECLFEQRDYHSIAAREVVEYRNYYLTEQLEKSLKLEADTNREPKEFGEHRKEHILVVDDHEDIRQFICRILEQAGYMTTQASSFKEGLRGVSQHVPDLVITDWMMGAQSGLDLIRHMRQREETEGIPIVLLTSRSDAESKAIGFESGADAYLTKPFVDTELQALVRNLLHLRRTERERGTQVRNQVMESVSVEVSIRVERALQQLRHVSRAIRDRVDVGRRLIAADNFDAAMVSDLEVMLDNVYRSTFDIVGALDRVTRISEQLEHLSGRHAAPRQLVWIPGLLDDVTRRLDSGDTGSVKRSLRVQYEGEGDKSLYLQRSLFEICLERLLSFLRSLGDIDLENLPIETRVVLEGDGAGCLRFSIPTDAETYQALSVAFGGYVAPADSDFDSVLLREALVGASWLEDAMHRLELSHEGGTFCLSINCVAEEPEDEFEEGDALFLDLDERPDAEVVDIQAHRGRYRS